MYRMVNKPKYVSYGYRTKSMYRMVNKPKACIVWLTNQSMYRMVNKPKACIVRVQDYEIMKVWHGMISTNTKLGEHWPLCTQA